MDIKILFIGDIVSKLGRNAVKELLPSIKKEYGIDFVIANGENTTNGRGISFDHYNELKSYGVDVFTSGDHIFHLDQTKDLVENLDIVIPLNSQKNVKGKRFINLKTKNEDITVVSLISNELGHKKETSENYENPYFAIRQFINEFHPKNLFIDFHAEFTSEKQALKYYLKDEAVAIVGTHTHIQTADEQIFNKKLAFITDCGMTGSTNSILGVESEIIVKRLLLGDKAPFEWVKNGESELNAVVITIDTIKNTAKNILRVNKKLN